jgi:hypothetical protein
LTSMSAADCMTIASNERIPEGWNCDRPAPASPDYHLLAHDDMTYDIV